MSRTDVLNEMGRLLLTGERKMARDLFYQYVIPSAEFSHREAYALAYRIGAIDEGDRHVATRADL